MDKQYSRALGWIVEDDGYHRGGIVPVHNKAKLFQASPEVLSVLIQVSDPGLTCHAELEEINTIKWSWYHVQYAALLW